MINRGEPQWYRDAIVYQLHVKSFFDSDNDGIGDFEGLTRKLDYVKELGATSIWLMPFYPSPLKDDGYDIADYRGINPSYGNLRDFRRFVREAHERDLRVITELVINHTSDQHPWFQRARKARPGSNARNFYVWSGTDDLYRDARIIFLDTEKSNWTWDEEAKAFFWHRFYSHQPDLNFDNPRVLHAVIDTMHSWFDMGVDGLRLDAIPYLMERDGTNCENLPETHVIIKKIRAALDEKYTDRMLLAEANQWPEETAQYFGDGDECHMAFHFPLMPRMYMALAQEDRHPITDIMRQTPEIPEGAQWAIFLRNHDELTLEMVTDKERDYLWSFYAGDRRMRINLGIRRRLAPLLENDRRKIELLNSMLFSMPGTPVLYYGDEIGMGDNIYLGDRDGVRTPMQWSPDRNGGFSRADPQRLFLPAIQDPIYGFSGVNVEAQLANPSSLLNWMRRMISVRRAHPAFGRGTLRFLYPSNRKVLAYLREWDDDRLLCIVNVSRAPQAVELDLSEFRGAIPIELTAGSIFPPIGQLPYLLTLPSYGFFWFKLEAKVEAERFGPKAAPELFTLVLTGPLEKLLEGREKIAFERTIVPAFLTGRRWFAGRGRELERVRLSSVAAGRAEGEERAFLLPIVEVAIKSGEVQHYFLPLALAAEGDEDAGSAYAIARVRRGARVGIVLDAEGDPNFALTMLLLMRKGERLKGSEGEIVFTTTKALPDQNEAEIQDGTVQRFGVEQSNTSFNIADRMVLKIYRRLREGINPEIEIGRFLTEVAGYANTPALYGIAEHIGSDGTRMALAVLQQFVRNQGDAWAWTLESLGREIERLRLLPENAAMRIEEEASFDLHYVRTIARRVAEMHIALAVATDDPAFASEPLTREDVEAVAEEARSLARRAYAAVERVNSDLQGDRADLARSFLDRSDAVEAAIAAAVMTPVGAIKTRIHGDLHLGQVLIARDDVMIVDFEGEPLRSLEERRMKASPAADVAGMLRSYAYAAATSSRADGRLGATSRRTLDIARLWQEMVEGEFRTAYDEGTRGTPVFVEDEATRRGLLNLHLLRKGLYEIEYEASHRPDWIDIPVAGVLDIVGQGPRT
ncbi:MAG: maltose alpha-D-glucosyltransferase / alpha-amylase [Methylobacteriaceae bacterium]|jgi:maltose alpha-D-glucosyltransferase/alpha-amylase|nr:maltose alpha-D-glucosyltransferase / alpha-amylase [Methylobacteriaceae bacterium]